MIKLLILLLICSNVYAAPAYYRSESLNMDLIDVGGKTLKQLKEKFKADDLVAVDPPALPTKKDLDDIATKESLKQKYLDAMISGDTTLAEDIKTDYTEVKGKKIAK